MRFTFDNRKNASNIEKHKVSFYEVQEIWNDPDLVIVPARRKGKKRKIAIGQAYAMMFSVVHTIRGTTIRIISARRSTAREIAYYEKKRRDRRA